MPDWFYRPVHSHPTWTQSCLAFAAGLMLWTGCGTTRAPSLMTWSVVAPGARTDTGALILDGGTVQTQSRYRVPIILDLEIKFETDGHLRIGWVDAGGNFKRTMEVSAHQIKETSSWLPVKVTFAPEATKLQMAGLDLSQPTNADDPVEGHIRIEGTVVIRNFVVR